MCVCVCVCVCVCDVCVCVCVLVCAAKYLSKAHLCGCTHLSILILCHSLSLLRLEIRAALVIVYNCCGLKTTQAQPMLVNIIALLINCICPYLAIDEQTCVPFVTVLCRNRRLFRDII